MHGRIEKLIAINSFKNIPKNEEMKQEKKPFVKEDCFFVLVPEKETFFHMFHDPMARYMENLYNHNLQMIVGCKLKDKGSDELMSILNMGHFTPDDVLRPWLSYVSGNYYFQTFQQIYQFLDGSQQGKRHEN